MAMPFLSISQQIIQTDTISTSLNNSTDWQVYFQNDQFKIEYKFSDCDPEMGYNNESVLLKISNLTENKISLEWHMMTFYNSKCNSCLYPEEYTFQFSLAPSEIQEGTCSIYSKPHLKIFSKFNDENHSKGQSLTNFKLSNLKFNLL
jgi:hypothetical protein